MTIMEALVGIIAIAFVIAVAVLARLAGHIGRASDEVALAARRMEELIPAARGLAEKGQTEMDALRSLTQVATDIVEDLQSISGQASAITSSILRGFESEVTHRYRAVFAGARAGLDVIRHFRSGNGSLASGTQEKKSSITYHED